MAANENSPAEPEWLEEMLAPLRLMEGEPLLRGVEAIADRFRDEGDADAHVDWLRTLMNLSMKQARLDWELRAFGRLQQLYESSERYADLRPRLLWYYKWLLERLPEFAEVESAAIDRLFADADAFYATAGESPRPLMGLRCKAALAMGRSEEATRWFEAWEAEPKGNSDDCAACEADLRVQYHLDREDAGAALAAAEPILAGEIGCAETPVTLSRLIVPAMRAEKAQLAFGMRAHSERPVRRSPNMLAALGHHVVASVMLNDATRASRLGRVALARAAETPNDVVSCLLYRAAALWLSVAAMTGQPQVRFPRSRIPDGTSYADAAAIALHLAREAALRLDHRNGNVEYAKRVNNIESTIEALATRMAGQEEQDRD